MFPWSDVGIALAEIRDSKLYRWQHKTFEDYCREKWGWEKRYCYQLIESAATVKALPEKVCAIVHTESQARELAKVEPEKRVEVLEQVAAAGPVTAKAIKEAAQQWRFVTVI